jgi:hypothetical protein
LWVIGRRQCPSEEEENDGEEIEQPRREPHPHLAPVF